jgi:hypothetical protein
MLASEGLMNLYNIKFMKILDNKTNGLQHGLANKK